MEISRFSPLTYGRDIRVSPHDPKVMYAALSPAARSTDGSIYRSDDVGRTWKRFDHGIKAEATMMAVAVHPRDPNQVYGVSRFGQLFGTQDGGRTWYEHRLAGGRRDLYASRLRLSAKVTHPHADAGPPSPRLRGRVCSLTRGREARLRSSRRQRQFDEAEARRRRAGAVHEFALGAQRRHRDGRQGGRLRRALCRYGAQPYSIETTSTICAAALGIGITPLVRVPSHDAHWSSRVLDGGARASSFPMSTIAPRPKR